MKLASLNAGLLVCVVALAGCSKNSGGGGAAAPQDLSNARQKRFENTANAIAQVSKWNVKSTTGVSGSSLNGLLADADSQPAAKTALENKIMTQKLCQIDIIQPKTGDANSGSTDEEIKFGMSIQGENCPISFSLNSDMLLQTPVPKEPPTLKMNFAIAYKSVSDEAKQALEVQEYSFKSSMSLSDTSVAGSGEGYVVTKTDGKVSLAYSATGGGESATFSLTMTYRDGLVVEIKEVDTKQGNNVTRAFFINNKPVDEKTFVAYMSKLLPGMLPGTQPDDTPSDPQGGGSSQPSGGSDLNP